MSLLLCLMVRYRPTSSSRLPQSLEFLETKMLCMCRLSPAVHSLSILTTGKDGFASQLCLELRNHCALCHFWVSDFRHMKQHLNRIHLKTPQLLCLGPLTCVEAVKHTSAAGARAFGAHTRWEPQEDMWNNVRH